MLLEKDSSVSIHDRNIQCLSIEMYKVSNGLSPPLVSNIFTQKIVSLRICGLILSFPDRTSRDRKCILSWSSYLGHSS